MEVISMSWTILTSLISSINMRSSKGRGCSATTRSSVPVGNLTGQTPNKRRATQSRSDLKDLNVACPFPVETEQHELVPDGDGADEMVTDEVLPDDENGGDSETSVQKTVDIEPEEGHNCGHQSKEEFLRTLSLSRAPQEGLDCVRREFECPACAAKGHPPKPGFPAALPRTFRFNETLGVVLFSD